MYTATVQVTINQFNPIGSPSGNIAATLSAPNNTSAPGTGGKKVFSGGSAEQLTVTLSNNYLGAVQLTYQLPDPTYVLLGISVNPTTVGSGSSVGRQQFRTITISRDPTGSQLTVTDSCLPGFNMIDFNYVILVQQVSNGQIGLIDPDIDNKTTEN